MPSPHRMQTFFSPAVIIGGALVIAAVATAYVFITVKHLPPHTYVSVATSTINETVQASGTVTPTESVDLGFQRGGAIATITVAVGDHVAAGQTLATVASADLQGELEQARANVAAEKAKLASLQTGTRPEQLATTDTALAQQINSSYVASDNAVRTLADQFILNPETQAPSLEFQTSDSALAGTVLQERVQIEQMLVAWQKSLPSQSALASSTLLSAEAESSAKNLSRVESFLDDTSTLLTRAVVTSEVPIATLTQYETNISTARTTIANSLSSLNAAAGQLSIELAGTSDQDLDAQKAAVASAAANVDTVSAELGQTVIKAPIAGTITVQNGNVGEVISAGAPIISLISDTHFEIDAYLSEADIGKVTVGQDATVTLDAYPGQTYDAKVVAIDPAATVQNGASAYKITAQFAEDNPAIKSGLTANVSIRAATAKDALTVPSSAIITKDGRTYVLRKNASGTDDLAPVSVGIASADGTTQILSGLQAGDQIEAFGEGY
ncbi:MAG: efflux RND transporter periplasmic adaptor subunit [Minisyncoccia bacterium]